MDSNQILTITVFVIVITIVGTIALAVVGYMAFRLRERKHPTRPGIEPIMSKPYFFERVRIPGSAAAEETPRAFEEAKPESLARPEAESESESGPEPDPGDDSPRRSEPETRTGSGSEPLDDGESERLAVSD